MLRHQTRPKSQPPIQLNKSGGTNCLSRICEDDEHWGQLIGKYAKSRRQLNKSNENCDNLPETDDTNDSGRELEISPATSSDSSLASSTLSLTTNSSASTVLAAMLSDDPAGTKPLFCLSSQTQMNIESQASLTSDEDDLNQLSSSSSSSPSSSGVSSSTISDTRMQHGRLGAKNTPDMSYYYAQDCSSSSGQSDEIGECIQALVDSVVASEQESIVNSDQVDNSNDPRHEQPVHLLSLDQGCAIDEVGELDDNTRHHSTVCLNEQLLNQDPVRLGANNLEPNHSSLSNVSSLEKFHLDSLALVKKAHMVKEFSLERTKLANLSLVANLACQYISNALERANTTGQREPNWMIAIRKDSSHPSGSSIEWRQSINTSEQIQGVRFAHIIECLIERELVIWIIDKNAPLATLRAEEKSESIELIKPIIGYNGTGKMNINEQNCDKQQQQVGLGNLVGLADINLVDVVIWLCSSAGEAKQFRDFWYRFEHLRVANAIAISSADKRLNASDESVPIEKGRQPSRRADTFNRQHHVKLDQGLEKDDSKLSNGNNIKATTADNVNVHGAAVAREINCSRRVSVSSDARVSSGPNELDAFHFVKSDEQTRYELPSVPGASLSSGQQLARKWEPKVVANNKQIDSNDGLDGYCAANRPAQQTKVVIVCNSNSHTTEISLPSVLKTSAAASGQSETRSGFVSKLARACESNSAASKCTPDTITTTGSKGNKNFDNNNETLKLAKNRSIDAKINQLGLLKKSASGLDLSIGSQQQVFGLASYYRNVASKVLSSGSNKIRSIRDEIVKLNHSNRQSLLLASHSSTLALNRPQQTLETSTMMKQELGSARSVSNLSSRDPIDRPNGSEPCQMAAVAAAGAGSAPAPTPAPVAWQDGLKKNETDHQHRHSSSSALAADKTGKLMNGASVPVVKPRTSILKKKQQEQCDNSSGQVDSIGTKSRLVGEHQLGRQVSSTAASRQPKSILKSNEPLANIEISERRQAFEGAQASSGSDVGVDVQKLNGKRISANMMMIGSQVVSSSEKSRNSQVNLQANRTSLNGCVADTSARRLAASNLSLEAAQNRQQSTSKQQQQQQQPRSTTTRTKNHQGLNNGLGNGVAERRKSISEYSTLPECNNHMRKDKHDQVEQDDGDDQNQDDPFRVSNDSSARKQAFERLKLRASCYGTAYVMSKSSLQNQLSQLRAIGSTDCILKNGNTSNSRQRRPAMLLKDSVANNANDGAKVSSLNEKRSSGVIKCSSSGADGTVRAKVSAAQLKRTVTEVDWQQANDNRSDQNYKQQADSVDKNVSEDPSRSRSRGSEFDTRSMKHAVVLHSDCLKETAKGTAPRRQSDACVGSCQTSESEAEPNTANMSKAKTGKQTKGTTNSDKNDKTKTKITESKRTTTHHNPSSSDSINSEDESSAEAADDSTNKPAASLSKSGPFSLLRQSFNQKTLSSMLKFSSRASLRIRPAAGASAKTVNDNPEIRAEDEPKTNVSAQEVAETNLIGVKQLKQQAQKIKEQKKREQSSIDQTTMILYNQHVQRQQQLMYQQQYAMATRGHLFDTTGDHVHLQQQMLYQRQQQQLAYMANQYMAQQMAVLPQAPLGPPAVMYVPQAATLTMQMHHHHHQQQITQSSGGISGDIFNKSVMKSCNRQAVQSLQLVYPPQPSQQLISMPINNHLSVDTVCASSPSTLSGVYGKINQHQQELDWNEKQTLRRQPKQSSLGASMRRTVKSILINRSSFLSASNNNLAERVEAKSSSNGCVIKPEQKQLKSALKSSTLNRSWTLNSDGSDGDECSSDSTTVNSNNEDQVKQTSPTTIKSVLKKTSNLDGHHHQQQQESSISSVMSSSSESSLTGGNSNFQRSVMGRCSRRILAATADKEPSDLSTLRASKRQVMATTTRKNVTFSTKLTSIL